MITELNTIEEFTLLLFFHMAHTDGSLHPNERDTILERMKALFPGDESINGKLLAMESQYSKLGDVRAEALLKASFPKFSGVDSEKKKEIYSALFDIINANGRINAEETKALHLFKGWLVG
ncbi:MAG: TerB family tellurite resistance protein [Cyclobacteriaceae bacterium]|nr:TerB family tellurite resistance protein [Cyclobacteriaceae bacterium]